MVNATDIPLHIRERFINRDTLDEIKGKLTMMPELPYIIVGDNIAIGGLNCEVVCTVKRLGMHAFFRDAAQDVRKLVEHVEAADEENDRLREHVKDLQVALRTTRE